MNEVPKSEASSEAQVVAKEVQGEAQGEVQVESQNVATPEMTTKEQLLSKGEENYERVSQAIGDARTKFSSWVKGNAAKFGRFFKGAVVRAFAAPAAISLGAKVGYEKGKEEVGYVKDATVQGIKYVGEKGKEGLKSVDDDIEKWDKFAEEKMKKTGEWIGYNSAAAYEFTTGKLRQADEWITKKEESLAKFGEEGVELAKDIAGVLADKSVEKFYKAKDGFEKRYGKVKEFGANSIDASAVLGRRAKDKFNSEWNAFRADMLKKRIARKEKNIVKGDIKKEREEEKLALLYAKYGQYKIVDKIEFSAVA